MAYQLGTFFQNFRRYVRSYDPTRMHDGSASGSPVAACNPFSYLGDNASLPINPCGQIAHSFFNDSFAFARAGGGDELPVDSSAIAWSSDADNLYGSVPAENYNLGGAAAPLRGGNTSEAVLNANQHWMVRAQLGLSADKRGKGAAWRLAAAAGGPQLAAACAGQPAGLPRLAHPSGKQAQRCALTPVSPAAPAAPRLAGVDASAQPGGGAEAVGRDQRDAGGGHQPDHRGAPGWRAFLPVCLLYLACCLHLLHANWEGHCTGGRACKARKTAGQTLHGERNSGLVPPLQPTPASARVCCPGDQPLQHVRLQRRQDECVSGWGCQGCVLVLVGPQGAPRRLSGGGAVPRPHQLPPTAKGVSGCSAVLSSPAASPRRRPAAVILSTNSWVGGRNNFLGACYIAVGGLCLLAALFFFLGYDLGERSLLLVSTAAMLRCCAAGSWHCCAACTGRA